MRGDVQWPDFKALSSSDGSSHSEMFGSLHSRSRDTPLRSTEIELDPLGFAQLARTNEDQGCELKRRASDRQSLS